LRQLDAARYSPGRYFDRSFRAGVDFLRENKLAAFSFAALYVLALLGIFKIRHYVAPPVPSANAPPIMGILAAPFSVALLIALLATGGTFASAPIGLAALFCLLYIIPVMRLLRPLIDPRLRPLLYFMAVFYAIEGFYLSIQLPPLIKRELYAVAVFAALASLLWLSRPSRLGSLLTQKRTRQILILNIRIALLLLAASLVANIVGYVFLALVLGLSVFVGPFLGAGFYSGALVLILVLNTVLHGHWAAEFSETSIEKTERWGGRLIALGAILLWARTILLLFRIYDSIMIAVGKILQHPIGSEKFRFTLGGTLSVVLILLAGYVLASALSFFLGRVVLPKLTLHRGVSYAISTIGHYILLLLVGLIALSTAGVELNRFTVLTGALGVGLGFGLQNIVNNFVSGLILLVERPIHVGDTIDVGGMLGTVRRMGSRSSTVLTPQGAEVIVPNSTLISNQVVNWTLSSPWRRVDVPIGVAFGTDPERVINLLVQVAASQPGVILERPPVAFVLGFGENALQFVLHFWSARHDTWLQLQSDVIVALARALREADIEIPFPQRDLHVRSGPTSIAEALERSELRTTSADAEDRRVRK
jgi:small-conductance mechanosensitive channel